MPLLPQWSNVRVPVIGMLHAPPLPGAHAYRGDFESVRRFVLQDAESLCSGGVDALMLENFGDTPFHPDRVPAVTVAAMTTLADDVRRRFDDLPLGINLLRNDGRGALAVAVATGAAFIRVNVLCGARVTDQGVLQGIAHDLLRDRAAVHAEHIRILADADVKHSAPLAQRSLAIEIRDLLERAHADAIIVSGQATGSATDLQTLAEAKRAGGSAPVLIGSGVAIDNVAQLVAGGADGLIVGTSIKREGRVHNPVDAVRVRELMQAVGGAAGTSGIEGNAHSP
jgi:uncharacterized protein